jgi:hypothetical protein
VAALFILTFVQPPIWLRGELDSSLIGGTRWAYRTGQSVQRAAPSVRAAST